MEPTEAVGTFKCNTPEEAVETLKQQVAGQVEDLVIIEVKELTDEDARAQVPAGTFLN